MVKEINQYRWSSYRAIAGLEGKPEFLTADWILSQLDKKKAEAEKAYKSLYIQEFEFHHDGRFKGPKYSR